MDYLLYLVFKQANIEVAHLVESFLDVVPFLGVALAVESLDVVEQLFVGGSLGHNDQRGHQKEQSPRKGHGADLKRFRY
jgi:hypothetical protein